MGNMCCNYEKKQEDQELVFKNSRSAKFCEQPTSAEIVINNDILISQSTGTPLEKYSIVKNLGEGSFGKVYLVRHKETGILRAMKEIINKDNRDFNDIKNEIDILKKLDHPNIVKIYEFFTKGNRFYLITEYCQYGELFEEINKVHRFTEQQTAQIMYQLLLSLYYCHINNIIHRDLKPENILIEERDKNDFLTIKVIDFGTAKVFQPNISENKVIGSAYYIAPEVIKKNYNEKCDLWSCGVIMYILLTGCPPFNGDDDNEIFQTILKKKYDTDVLSKCSSQSKDLIAKFLNRNVNERISAGEALNHPFFKKFKPKDNNVDTNQKISLFINNLKSFKSTYKLQEAAIAIIVHNIPHNEEIKELERAFRFIDENGDGRLTKEELINGQIKYMGKTENEAFIEVDKIFKQVDADRNGYIEYEEFIRACIKKETLFDDKYLKFAFSFFDKDGSGQITVSEIKEVFCGGNKNVNHEDLERLINEVDTNGDGQVSYEEFKEMMFKIVS
jgi:calcium-dependent protein kinase